MFNINTVLSNLQENHSLVTSVVPNAFYFSDEPDSSYIKHGRIKIYEIDVKNDDILLIGEGIAGFQMEDGSFGVPRAVYGNGVCKLNADGSINENFARFKFDSSEIYAGGLQSNGKSIVGGYFSQIYSDDPYSANNIVRLDAEGYPDDTFNIGSGLNNLVNKIVVLSDDSILVSGYFSSFNGTSVKYLIKLNSDGTLNTTFNDNVIASGFNTPIYNIFVMNDGSILVSDNNYVLTKFSSVGVIDNGFSASANDAIFGVGEQSDGKIIIGGNFNTVNSNSCAKVARLNSDGSFDNTFSVGTYGFELISGEGGYNNSDNIFDLVVQNDNKIIVTGGFNAVDRNLSRYVCRLESNGSFDSSFGNPNYFDYYGRNIKLASDGSIWIAGEFFKPTYCVAKLDSNGILSLDGFIGIPLENPTYSIDDGFSDMYDDGNFINTNNTNYFEDFKNDNVEDDDNPIKCIPYTHRSTRDNIWRTNDPSYTKSYAYLPQTINGVISNGGFYKKPYWVDTFMPDNLAFGWDENGMWFTGNANGDSQGYPVRTNFNIGESITTTLTFTFIHNVYCSDQSVCFYVDGDNPVFNWNTDSTRIAYALNCEGPALYGKTVSSEENSYNLVDGETYTAVVVYNPTGTTVTATLYLGTEATGSPVSTLSINEVLSSGNYRIGFSADDDGGSGSYPDNTNKSYFTYVLIESDGDTYEMKRKYCFGEGSSYFTNMYPGMFVLAATNIDIDEFSITGDVGSDEDTQNSGFVYPLNVNGREYNVFYKSNFGDTSDPAIHHLIILPGSTEGITQTINDDGDDYDDHCLTGLTGKDELYYVLIGTANSETLPEENIKEIATKFLSIISGSKTYTLNLFGNENIAKEGEEGSLDTSIYEGKSQQRTLNFLETVNINGDMVIHGQVNDGESFSDKPQGIGDYFGITQID